LRYADDITLLASTQEKIRKFFKDLVQESARCNTCNQCTEVQNNGIVSRQDNNSVQVDHEGESMEQCTTLNSWNHTSQQMEIAQNKLKDA